MATKINKDAFKNALLAIEYRADAKVAFDSLANTPMEYKIQFLELLEQNPKGVVEDFLNTVKIKYDEWLNPYDNDRFNNALHEARNLGPNAEKEFIRVIEVLGDSAQPTEILQKIQNKFKPIQLSPKDPLKTLITKHGCASSEELMKRLGIIYNSGVYVFNDKRHESFIEAAIEADLETPVSAEQINTDISEIFSSDQETINESSNNESPQQQKGFFSKLINGDYGLPKTYWLFGVLGNLLFIIPITLASAAKSLAILVLALLISVVYSLIVLVGIWRASDKYQGAKVWSVLAKIAVILGILQLLMNLILLGNI